MKKSLLSIVALFVFASVSIAQQEQKTNADVKASNNTSVSKSDKSINLASGTELTGELQNALDVRKAKVGDKVVLKTTKAIKENGKTVLSKGSRLIGHVSSVQQKTKENAQSSVGIVFDKLENGSLTAPIQATITSITQAASSTNINDDSVMSDTSIGSNTSARTSGSAGSNGGLLGGVTNTVGNVVGTTTNTVGSVVNTTGETLGNTTRTVGNTVSGIRISQSSDVNAEGGSTLQLTGGNLKLEKGTVFRLSLSEALKIGKE